MQDGNGQPFWQEGAVPETGGQWITDPSAAPGGALHYSPVQRAPTYAGAYGGAGRPQITTNQGWTADSGAPRGAAGTFGPTSTPLQPSSAGQYTVNKQADWTGGAPTGGVSQAVDPWAARQQSITNGMRLGSTPAASTQQPFTRYGQPTTANTAPGAPGRSQEQLDLADVYDSYAGAYRNGNQRIADLYPQVQQQNDYIRQAQGAMAQNDQARFANTNNANALDFGWLKEFEGQTASTNASNQAYMNDLNGLYGSMSTPLQARGYGANVQSDPQAMAMQMQAWGQLQGAATGSLDYQSQAAQAYADARAVQQQQAAYERLNGIANGNLDIEFDPELRKRQNEALQQYDDWRTPKLTAEEEFMKEQARYEQEQQESASRKAYADKFARQGMGGSGLELQMGAQQSQQNSYNRLLRDLGSNANAVARAERALQGYAEYSGQMQDQDTALKSFNTNTRLNASGMSSDAARGLRQDSFNEEYSRGMAADSASANNQATRLGGMQSSAQLSSTMRDQADTMSRFNKEQSLIQQRYQDTYAQTERDAAWGRGMDRTNMGVGINQTNLGNNQNLLNNRTGINQNAWARSDGTLSNSDNSWMNRVGMGQTALSNSGSWTQAANGNDQFWVPIMGSAKTAQVGDRVGEQAQKSLYPSEYDAQGNRIRR